MNEGDPFTFTAVIDEIKRVTFVLFLVIYCKSYVTYEPFQLLLSLPIKFMPFAFKSRDMLYVYLTIIPRARISAESIAIRLQNSRFFSQNQ